MATRELTMLREDALALSEVERATLAHDLVASLDGPVEQGIVDAWDKEIVFRINEIDGGNAALIDVSEVISEIRKRIT